MRPSSVKDVAQAAKVSIATVSRYFNSPQLLAPATAERVQQAIESLGYRPNHFARGLMTRRSGVVGIILPDIHGEFYSELLRGADAAARARGYHLLVTSEGLVEGQASALASSAFGLVDGVALMITEPNEELWRQSRATRVPLVALDAAPEEDGVDSVLLDNASGAAEATRHLLAGVGPQRCFFVGGPADNYDTRDRSRAFAAVLKGAGWTPRPEQVAFGTYSPQWGRSWAAGMLDEVRRGPIGVLAGDDEIALGVMDALLAAGFRVPQDARIVGFDDSRLASLLRPPLSSVRVPRYELGETVIDTLVRRMADADAPVLSRRLPTNLVVRESSRM